MDLVQVGGDLRVRPIVVSHYLWVYPSSSVDFCLGSWQSVSSLPSTFGLPHFHFLNQILRGKPIKIAWRRTCMSVGRAPSAVNHLIESLSIAAATLRGIAHGLEQATSFSEQAGPAPAEEASTSSSSGEWDVVSDSAPEIAQHVDLHERLAAGFPALPGYCIGLCDRLGGSKDQKRSRAERAWIAGNWAKATLEGKVRHPRPTPPLVGGLRNSVYVVLKAPGLTKPVVLSSAKEYFKLIPAVRGSHTVSHAFPSIAEAKVYCAGASFEFPASQ